MEDVNLINRLALELLAEYEAKYECIGEGRRRKVFVINERLVAKVAKDEWGVVDNYSEARNFSSEGRDGYIPMAECFLLHVNDLPVVFMERVEPVHIPYEEAPSWLGWVDCGQVGYAKDGKLVAYDYPDNY